MKRMKGEYFGSIWTLREVVRPNFPEVPIPSFGRRFRTFFLHLWYSNSRRRKIFLPLVCRGSLVESFCPLETSWYPFYWIYWFIQNKSIWVKIIRIYCDVDVYADSSITVTLLRISKTFKFHFYAVTNYEKHTKYL